MIASAIIDVSAARAERRRAFLKNGVLDLNISCSFALGEPCAAVRNRLTAIPLSVVRAANTASVTVMTLDTTDVPPVGHQSFAPHRSHVLRQAMTSQRGLTIRCARSDTPSVECSVSTTGSRVRLGEPLPSMGSGSGCGTLAGAIGSTRRRVARQCSTSGRPIGPPRLVCESNEPVSEATAKTIAITIARRRPGKKPLIKAVLSRTTAGLQNLCGVVTPRSVGSTPAPLRQAVCGFRTVAAVPIWRHRRGCSRLRPVETARRGGGPWQGCGANRVRVIGGRHSPASDSRTD